MVDQNQKQLRYQRSAAQQARYTDDNMLDDDVYDDVWPIRLPTSSRNYQRMPDIRTETGRRQVDSLPITPQQYHASGNTRPSRAVIPPRRSATQTGLPVVQTNRQRNVYTEEIFPTNTARGVAYRPGLRFHWLVFIGLAMIIMIIGWFTFSALGNWWQVTQDDWHYGRPRTFQIDAVVGHNDSPSHPSHFIAMNLNRRVLIIELPGGDSSKAKIYTGPVLIGQGQDLAAVTLSFQDVNADGLVDMIVNVQDAHFVYINANGMFRPARSG
jgi:hypothetical protein